MSGSGIAGQIWRAGWRFPFTGLLAPRTPVTLLYHGVPAGHGAEIWGSAFEQHVLFLKRHFDLVRPRDRGRPRGVKEKPQVLLTFDDGFRNNAGVAAPILRRHKVPALFFVSSRHATAGRYLWFTYLSALERWFPPKDFSFRGTLFRMSAGDRQTSVQRLKKILLDLTPHPEAMYQAIESELPPLEDFVGGADLSDHCAGMTEEQTAELAASSLFSIGAHTIDHPFLTRCEPDEARRQIEGNRSWIEAACGSPCDAIAYPSGDYSAGVIDMCRRAGFTRGYAVTTRIDGRSAFEIERIGIYAESTDILGFKLRWGTLLRRMRLPIG